MIIRGVGGVNMARSSESSEETRQKNMGVHIFEVNIGNCEIKGFSKVRKPSKIKNVVQLNDPKTGQNLLIHPAQWEHRTEIVWEWALYKSSEELRNRFAAVKRGEFVAGIVPRSKFHLYVFKIEMDAADIRVFCTDKNATSWKSWREQRLTEYKFNQEIFVGETDISGREDCMKLGLLTDSVYEQIESRGFFTKVDKVYSGLQRMERAVLWEIQRKPIALGIKVTNFSINDIQVSGTERTPALESQASNEDISISADSIYERLNRK